MDFDGWGGKRIFNLHLNREPGLRATSIDNTRKVLWSQILNDLSNQPKQFGLVIQTVGNHRRFVGQERQDGICDFVLKD